MSAYSLTNETRWRAFVLISLSICAIFALGGCASRGTPEPEIRIQEVVIEKPVACAPANLEAPPTYPDTDEALAAAASSEERYARVIAGRLLRIARLASVEPVIEVCREPKQ